MVRDVGNLQTKDAGTSLIDRRDPSDMICCPEESGLTTGKNCCDARLPNKTGLRERARMGRSHRPRGETLESTAMIPMICPVRRHWNDNEMILYREEKAESS